MDTRTVSIIAICVIVAAVIFVPVVKKLIQDLDYKRQIRGDIPMRSYDGNASVLMEKEQDRNPSMEAEATRMKANTAASTTNIH